MKKTRLWDLISTWSHDNIVQLLPPFGDILMHACYIDMELFDYSLAEYIDKKKEETRQETIELKKLETIAIEAIEPVSWGLGMAEIWEIVIQIAAGLEFIHGKSIVYGNLKPTNGAYSWHTALISVLFSKNRSVWKISDFAMKGEEHFQGSPKWTRGAGFYRALEMIDDRNEWTSKGDIWALGCILHYLICGWPAFRGVWSVVNYDDTELAKLVALYPEKERHIILELEERMLRTEPAKRDDVAELKEAFVQNSRHASGMFDTTGGRTTPEEVLTEYRPKAQRDADMDASPSYGSKRFIKEIKRRFGELRFGKAD
jgi:serine/threonine protein kinase